MSVASKRIDSKEKENPMTDGEDRMGRPTEEQEGLVGRAVDKARERGLIDESMVERAREKGLLEKANGALGALKNRFGGK